MKKILSTVLAFLLCFMSFFAVDITANAAVSTIETISEGETWRQSWSEDVDNAVLNLYIEETEFYNITVDDYNQNGYFYIRIYDLTADEYVGYIYEAELLSTYTSDRIYMFANHNYQLTCTYYASTDDTEVLPADMGITFNKCTEELPVLPTCSLNSSNMLAQFDDDDSRLWLQYTPTQTGDYGLYFGDLHAYIYIYEADTGELVSSMDTEYWSDYYDEWSLRDRVVFRLNAYTKYYIEISSYGGETSTRLSMLKNSKNVKNLAIYEQLYSINSFTYFDESYFSYLVTYTDNSTEIVYDLEDWKYAGYVAPSVDYEGGYSEINGRTYPVAGLQPVSSTYNGNSTVLYVEIESVLDWLIEEDANAVLEGKTCTISYEDEEEHSYWWRINVTSPGIYAIWRYNSDDFATNFDSYSIEIIDDMNNVVEYDYDNNGWVLYSDKEYVLNFRCQYNADYWYNDIDFWLQKNAELKSGWVSEGGQWLYYNSGVKAISWQSINNNWYYFNDSGIMQTGWQYINYNWYYFSDSGNMLTGWQYINNYWYYFGDSGNMLTGWQYIGSSWYYFAEGGNMVTGWQYIGSSWYYFHTGGNMATGWLNLGGTWYYLAEGGNMLTGWQSVGGTWYYFHAGGNMATGWLLLGNTWYCFADGGAMLTGWHYIGGYWYYFNSYGAWVA